MEFNIDTHVRASNEEIDARAIQINHSRHFQTTLFKMMNSKNDMAMIWCRALARASFLGQEFEQAKIDVQIKAEVSILSSMVAQCRAEDEMEEKGE
jgi:hypothetical protein